MTVRGRGVLDRVGRISGPVADAAVAAVMLVIMALIVGISHAEDHRLLRMAALIPIAAGIALRRRWPLPALLVVEVIGTAAFGTTTGVTAAASLVCLVLLSYGLGAFAGNRATWIGLGALLIFAVYAGARSSLVVPSVFFLTVGVAILPWRLGRLARRHADAERSFRQMSEELDADRELRTSLVVVTERARLARELHDVIAHCVSVMVIQSAGARSVMTTDTARADAALLAAERAGQDALVEMRRLLNVLTDPNDAPRLEPQPGLDDMDDLIAQTIETGLMTRLRVEGKPVTVSPGVGLCVYRIVQEALTNCIKHSGPARADVCIRWTPTAVELEIVDDGRGGVRSSLPRGGHGLSGMRERAALHGGSVRTGPEPSGGYAVRARIPTSAVGALP